MFNLIFLYMEPCFCHLINKVAVLQKKNLNRKIWTELPDLNSELLFFLIIQSLSYNSKIIIHNSGFFHHQIQNKIDNYNLYLTILPFFTSFISLHYAILFFLK